MREILLTHKDILIELEKLQKSINYQEDRIDLLYDYLKNFINQEKKGRKEVGYKKNKQ